MSAHRLTTTVLSLLVVGLGVAMLVRALAAGGGPLAIGVVFGVLFILGGALRLYLIRSAR